MFRTLTFLSTKFKIRSFLYFANIKSIAEYLHPKFNRNVSFALIVHKMCSIPPVLYYKMSELTTLYSSLIERKG